MSDYWRIPCVLMRGGTSRGPFFLASDLPADPQARDRLLVHVMGAGHPLEIDGIGGGHPLTSKVAIIGRPTREGADVDYLFAQVKVGEAQVDTGPNCGNMLAGVAPFAIEAGLVAAQPGRTTVRIHNVNTGTLIEASVETPHGALSYDGDTRIDGVPGSAAPIRLTFLDAAGALTGRLFPTGRTAEEIDGIRVTCIDMAMPLVLLDATALGKAGDETPAALDADRDLLRQLESIRLEAGRRMGLGDVSGRVVPKPVLLSPPRRGGALTARYFMPASCHTALAATGGVGIATACAIDGTVAADIARPARLPVSIDIEHPSGRLSIALAEGDAPHRPRASVVRTARRLFEGHVCVLKSVLAEAPRRTAIA